MNKKCSECEHGSDQDYCDSCSTCHFCVEAQIYNLKEDLQVLKENSIPREKIEALIEWHKEAGTDFVYISSLKKLLQE